MKRLVIALSLTVAIFVGCLTATVATQLVVPPIKADTNPQKWEYQCMELNPGWGFSLNERNIKIIRTIRFEWLGACWSPHHWIIQQGSFLLFQTPTANNKGTAMYDRYDRRWLEGQTKECDGYWLDYVGNGSVTNQNLPLYRLVQNCIDLKFSSAARCLACDEI